MKMLISKENRSRKNKQLNFDKNNFSYQIFEIDDKEPYYNLECDECTNYGYFSYMMCNNCKVKMCLNHNFPCYHFYKNKALTKILLYYRNLTKIKEQLDEYI